MSIKSITAVGHNKKPSLYSDSRPNGGALSPNRISIPSKGRETAYYQAYDRERDSDVELGLEHEEQFDQFVDNFELSHRLSWDSFTVTFQMVVATVLLLVTTAFIIHATLALRAHQPHVSSR